MINPKFILLLIIIGACAYARFKFDLKYVKPVFEENPKLESAKNVCIALVGVALICGFSGLSIVSFIILIPMIPVALYMNSKIYGSAWEKHRLDKKSQQGGQNNFK